MKIQWKSMYVRCIYQMNFFKNLNSLNVQNCENSRKNYVHQMYRQYEFVECRNSRKIDGKSMNVPNREGVHKMYIQSRLVEKFDFVESTK